MFSIEIFFVSFVGHSESLSVRAKHVVCVRNFSHHRLHLAASKKPKKKLKKGEPDLNKTKQNVT